MADAFKNGKLIEIKEVETDMRELCRLRNHYKDEIASLTKMLKEVNDKISKATSLGFKEAVDAT